MKACATLRLAWRNVTAFGARVVQEDLGDTPPSELAPKAPDLTRSKERGSLTSRSRAPAFHSPEGDLTDAALQHAFFAFGLALGLLVWPTHATLANRPALVPSPG